jgi:hypothetical protein
MDASGRTTCEFMTSIQSPGSSPSRHRDVTKLSPNRQLGVTPAVMAA